MLFYLKKKKKENEERADGKCFIYRFKSLSLLQTAVNNVNLFNPRSFLPNVVPPCLRKRVQKERKEHTQKKSPFFCLLYESYYYISVCFSVGYTTVDFRSARFSNERVIFAITCGWTSSAHERCQLAIIIERRGEHGMGPLFVVASHHHCCDVTFSPLSRSFWMLVRNGSPLNRQPGGFSTLFPTAYTKSSGCYGNGCVYIYTDGPLLFLFFYYTIHPRLTRLFRFFDSARST